MTKMRLGCVFHLLKYHCRNLFRMEAFCATLVLDLYKRFVVLAGHNLKWPILHVFLDTRVLELPAYQALGIVDGSSWISCSLTLGCIAHESLCLCERHIRRCRSFAFCVFNDLGTSTLPYANARVCGPEVYTNGRHFLLLLTLHLLAAS
mmetsp:Transcript_20097/g.36350  ORF Transcript_20097/g.36350 Transcript_20097/m.36350 type:complete len:149 (-) Transcript_20097:263-709(-)